MLQLDENRKYKVPRILLFMLLFSISEPSHFKLFLPFIHLYRVPYFFLSYFSHAPASYTEHSFPFSFFAYSFYFTPPSASSL